MDESLTFSEALEHLREGGMMTRKGWRDGRFLFLVPGSEFVVNRKPLLGIYAEGARVTYHPHIDMKTAGGHVVPWTPTQEDMLTDDWQPIAAGSQG